VPGNRFSVFSFKIPEWIEQMLYTCTFLSICNEEPGELIRYAALIHNSVMTATSTEQWETTSWFFQDVSDVTFIVFHRVVRQRHLLR
jgi:hypothetical protein